MIPTTEMCCCCISLRAGSIFIGIILVISNCLSVLDPLDVMQYMGKDDNEDKENERQRTFVIIYLILEIIFSILLVIAGVCIIVAAWKYLPNLLKFATLFLLGYTMGSFVIAFLFLFSHGNFLRFIFDFFTFAVCLYYVVVLWSFYQEMLEDDEEEEDDKEDDY